MPVVDPYPAMRVAARSRPLYWEKDIHCNAEGYRVIAETLYTRLGQLGLIPDSGSE